MCPRFPFYIYLRSGRLHSVKKVQIVVPYCSCIYKMSQNEITLNLLLDLADLLLL
jgi:hypothetical protein